MAADVVNRVRIDAPAMDSEKLLAAVERRLASARKKLDASPVDMTEVLASRMVRRLLSPRLVASLGRVASLDRRLSSAIRRRRSGGPAMPSTDTSVTDVLSKEGAEKKKATE